MLSLLYLIGVGVPCLASKHVRAREYDYVSVTTFENNFAPGF